MSDRPEIPRSVLADQVQDRLLQSILEGRFPPGSRIVETQVAKEYGVSQAPVREALRGLEAIGIVEINAFRGARVRQPSASELLEAFVVRAQLEKLGARLALPRLTDGDLVDLGEDVAAMERAARAGDSHAEAEADAAFHGRIVALAANGTLERVWRTLEPFSRTYVTLVAPGVDRVCVAGLHGPILDALRAGDAAGVAATLQSHYDVAGAMLLDPRGRPGVGGGAGQARDRSGSA